VGHGLTDHIPTDVRARSENHTLRRYHNSRSKRRRPSSDMDSESDDDSFEEYLHDPVSSSSPEFQDVLPAPGPPYENSSESDDEDKSGSPPSQSTGASESEKHAAEFKSFVSDFYKRDDIRKMIDEFSVQRAWPVGYNTYLREYIAYHHFTPGSNARDKDNACCDDLKNYIRTVFSNGKDENGNTLTQDDAMQFKFIASAKNLEDFLENYFVKCRRRNKTALSSATEVSEQMIGMLTAAAQSLNSKELTIWRIAHPDKPDPPGVRNTRIRLIREKAARQTYMIRRMAHQDQLIQITVADQLRDQFQKILDFCFMQGDSKHLRMGCQKSAGTAMILRGDCMENITLDVFYFGHLGNDFISGLLKMRIMCAYIIKSKTNRFGLSFVTGCCHNVQAKRDPMFYTGLYLLDRFLPEERGGQGGSYPELHRPGGLDSMYLLFPEGSPNTTQKISESKTLQDIRTLLASATNISEDYLAVCKKRHGPRGEGVVFMMDGDVPPESQNSLGNWGSKERRNSHYAYAALDRTAVLTMGGTAKTERGQHHNPTWNRIQPPIELVDLVLPVSAEWDRVLKDKDHPKWDENGAKLTSGAISFNKVPLKILKTCFVLQILNFCIKTTDSSSTGHAGVSYSYCTTGFQRITT
jgi:hypothetical protein